MSQTIRSSSILFTALWALPSFAASGVPLQKNPVFWLFICFAIFIFLMLRFALKPLFAMLDNQAEMVSTRLSEARALREKAIQLHAEAERAKGEAILEAQRIIEYAQKDAETILAQGEKDLMQHIEKRKKIVDARIELAENRAIIELKNSASELATSMAATAIDQQLSEQNDQQIIDQTIANLPNLLASLKN